MTRRVLFLAPYVKSYRLPLFERLHAALAANDITMRVAYGSPNRLHAERQDNVCLPSKYGVPVKSWWFAERVVAQAAWREIALADLIVTPHENKMLLNPLLLALRAAGGKRVAFWGKGDLEPATILQPGEWARCRMARAVDWWFPYTQQTARQLRTLGVKCGITVLENSIDTTSLQQNIDSVTDGCVQLVRTALDMGTGPAAIYCGNLSQNKEVDFLFTAAKIIHAERPDFRLLIIGNGPMREQVERISASERFIHYFGARIGREKALLLKASDLFLLPGAVGLAVLDSFTAGLPLVTTETPRHGPEFSYLVPSVNGAVTKHDAEAYARKVLELLSHPDELARLQSGARKSGAEHSIEKMAGNFQRGILDCLQSVPARRFVLETGVTQAKDLHGGD